MSASVSTTESAAGSPTGARTPLWLAVTLAIVFGLFYAYDVWEAVGNLVGLAQFAAALDTTFTPVGWVVLLAGILLPVLLFAAAFVAGRRRGPLLQAAFYAVGLAVSAAWSLDILAAFGPGNILA
ncbi:hypothetical protein WDJ51_05255 [Rathayibacter sp. YIM 133350]|uniref:hypothetical protein n=1 Tax=Rathayibacter sp. YIM 133350 TaxID=3131992 RepID=UPI00307EE5AE